MISRPELHARIGEHLHGLLCPEGCAPDVVVADEVYAARPAGIPGILVASDEVPPAGCAGWEEVVPLEWLPMLRERIERYLKPRAEAETACAAPPEKEHAFDLHLQVHPHVRVTHVSASIEEILGYPAKMLVDDRRLLLRLMDARDRRIFLAGLRRPSFYREPFVFRAVGRDLAAVTFEATFRAILGVAGRIVGAEGVLRSLSHAAPQNMRVPDETDWYRLVLESLDQGVMVTDPAGRPIFHNRALREMTGFSSLEMQGEGFRWDEGGRASTGGTRIHTMVSRTGDVKSVSVSESVLRTHGTPLVLYVLTDVTHDEEKTRLIRQQWNQLQLVLHHLPVLVWEMDADGRLVYLEGSLLDRTAMLPRRFLGRRMDALFSKDPEWPGLRERLFAGQNETILRTFRDVTMRIHLRPVTEIDGTVCGIMGLCTDISDVLLAVDALRRQKSFFESLFDQLPVGVYTLDPLRDFDGTMVNRRGAELLGVEADRPDVNRYPLQEDPDRLEELLGSGGSGIIRLERIRLDGRAKQCLKILMVPVSAGGESPVVLGIVEDVSEQREYEEQILLAREEAEKANADRSRFLAQMSHEIRTPLNAIVGYTEILLSRMEQESPLRDYLFGIQASGRKLTDLVNEILSFSKGGAGGADVHQDPVEIARLLHDVENMLTRRAAERHLHLTVRVADAISPRILFHEGRLRQVLVALAESAIQRTVSGEVEIDARTEPDPVNDGCVSLTVCVRDTGVAMTTDEGSDVGLAIAERLVRSLGGTVDVRSVSGQGSTFRLYFPCVRVAGVEGSVPPSSAPGQLSDLRFGGARVLVVDDDASNREVTAEFLSGLDLQVAQAGDGTSALDVVQRDHCDLILTDMHMPGMDGRELAARIRRLPGYESVPIVALSGDTGLQQGDPGDPGGEASGGASAEASTETSASASVDLTGFLQKPFSRDQLLLVVARFLEFALRSDGGSSRHSAEGGDVPGEIHIADDAALQRLIARTREVRASLNLNDIGDLGLDLGRLANRDGNGGALRMGELLREAVATVSVGRIIHLLDHLLDALVRGPGSISGR